MQVNFDLAAGKTKTNIAFLKISDFFMISKEEVIYSNIEYSKPYQKI